MQTNRPSRYSVGIGRVDDRAYSSVIDQLRRSGSLWETMLKLTMYDLTALSLGATPWVSLTVSFGEKFLRRCRAASTERESKPSTATDEIRPKCDIDLLDRLQASDSGDYPGRGAEAVADDDSGDAVDADPRIRRLKPRRRRKISSPLKLNACTTGMNHRAGRVAQRIAEHDAGRAE